MPVDTRRIAGPSISQPTSLFVDKEDSKPLINEKGKRADGRTCSEFRSLFFKLGVNKQARGSSYAEIGNTKIHCAIYGPRDIMKKQTQEMHSTQGQLYCEIKFAPFSCQNRRQRGILDKEEKDMSAILQRALEPVVCLYQFPKAQVDIFVTVLENDGGILPASITAAGLAMCDAGIAMYDMISACSLVQDGDSILVDPSSTEEETFAKLESSEDRSRGVVTLAMTHHIPQVALLEQIGSMDADDVASHVKQLTSHCRQLFVPIEEAVTNSIQTKMGTLKVK